MKVGKIAANVAAACLAAALAGPHHAAVLADEAPVPGPVLALEPRTTAKALVSVAVGATNEAPRQISIGLFGEAAPESVRTFRGLCDGTLPDSPGVTYRGSAISRVERDKLISVGVSAGGAQTVERTIDSTGYVRTEYINRADAFKNNDVNGLRHDQPGRVSMQKGGGSFLLTVAPAANKALDESNVVIGQVLQLDDMASGSAGLLRDMNEVPVRQPKAETSLYRAVAQAGGDPRTKVETVFRPLRKITVVGCQTRDR